MSRSISFSRATASAIASSSALLAEIAVAMFRLSFHLNSIGAVRGKRSSRCNKVVSQQKLCMVYGGKRQCHRAQFRHIGQQHIAVVQAAKPALELLAPVARLPQAAARDMALPVVIILRPCRSEGRRVGKECGSTGRSRRCPTP